MKRIQSLRFVRACLIPFLAMISAGCQSAQNTESRQSWLGVNTQLGYPDFEGAYTGAKGSAAERARYLDLVADLGAPPVRDLVMSWARAQIAPGGVYDFALSDELVKEAQTRKAKLLALCLGTPGWASSRKNAPLFDFGVPAREREEAFRRFVREFVERYDGDGNGDVPGLTGPVHDYEFMQEMEDVPADEYAFWLRVFYETVKDADPKATVSMGSLKSPGCRLASEPGGQYPEYLERVLASEALKGPQFPYFDVVSFHSYPDSYSDRRPFDEPLAYIKRVLGANSVDRPVWVTEFGADSCKEDDARQSTRLVQWALKLKAAGVQRAYIYSLYDCRWVNERTPECLGLVRETPAGQPIARKPAFESVRTLVRELGERPDVTRKDENLYELGGGKSGIAFAVWQATRAGADPTLLTSDWWEVRMLDGRKIQRQGTQVEVGPEPMFVQHIKSPFLSPSGFLNADSLVPIGPKKEDEAGDAARDPSAK